jgi:AraC-like DNA-binding protein
MSNHTSQPEDSYTDKVKVTEYAHGEIDLSEKIHPDSTLVLKYSGPLCYARVREVHVDAASVVNIVIRTKNRVRVQIASSEPLLMLYIVLKGNLQYIVGKRITHTARFHYNLLYQPSLQQDFILEKNQQYVLLAVHFRPAALQQWSGLHPLYSHFLEQAAHHESAALFHQARPASQALVYAAQNLFRRASMYDLKIMRQVALLEVLRHAVMPLFAPRVALPPALRPADLEKVHAARAYIFDHLDQAISVRTLARIAGLNERKLKLGFHTVYHTTIGGFLREERMLRALTLLKEKKMPVARVATAVGYRHAPNFSDAFRRHFGHPPTLCSVISRG